MTVMTLKNAMDVKGQEGVRFVGTVTIYLKWIVLAQELETAKNVKAAENVRLVERLDSKGE